MDGRMESERVLQRKESQREVPRRRGAMKK
jgi:hypothetical protein